MVQVPNNNDNHLHNSMDSPLLINLGDCICIFHRPMNCGKGSCSYWESDGTTLNLEGAVID